VDSCCWWKKS